MSLSHFLARFCTLCLILLQISNAATLSSSYANTSTVTDCNFCNVEIAENGVIIRGPVTAPLTASYVTEVVEINKNGTTVPTITDFNASASFDQYVSEVLQSQHMPPISEGGNIQTVYGNETWYVVWEDLMISYIDYATLATINGTQTCQYSTLDYASFTGGSFDGELSSSIPASLLSLGLEYFLDPVRFPNSQLFSSYGISLPSDCSVTQVPGSPIVQVPVQYLTATSTINNLPTPGGGSSPTSTTPASPASTLQPPGPTPTEDPTGTPPGSSPSGSPGSPDGQGASSSQGSGSSQSEGSGGSPVQTQPTALPEEQSSTQPSVNVSPSPGTGGPSPVATVVTMAGVPFSISSNIVYVGSQTLEPGSAITVSGTPISVAPSAAAVIIGTSTIPLNPSATSSGGSPPVLSLGGSTYVQNSASAFVVGSQTLTPGGVITIDGTSVSLAPSATAVVIGTSTIPLNPSAASPAGSPAVISLGSSTFIENSASAFVIGSQTLTPGGVITIDGTSISLAPSATAVIIGTNTIPLSPGPVNTAPPELFTLGTSILTANPASGLVIGSQTLTPGGVITFSGTVVSLASGATAFVIGSSTETLAGVSATASANVGGLIYSAFGGGSSSPTTTASMNPGIATGAASALNQTPVKWMIFGWLLASTSVWVTSG